ncbi:hypothetical protein DPEC_G00345050 [Dallia pectoralis]|uniref:Uncharacterized protein n=1 Tax=Dallia pectoralis TaxID=75939 RepID=A0ACC2F3J7_DALPE|nr:hypothetical protein DPEC_G00345050 [Dallia pectoralis]
MLTSWSTTQIYTFLSHCRLQKEDLVNMIGKILAHFLSSTDDFTEDDKPYKEFIEVEAGEWVIINVQENYHLTEDPFENLLIEHPSMSVYQVRSQNSDDEDLSSDEEDSRWSLPIKQCMSWRLAALGIILPCHTHLLAVQQARIYRERKTLTRSALHRQNLAKTRFSPSDRRHGPFKQPCQRL